MEFDHLKKEKAKAKASFTWTLHRLCDLEEDVLPSRRLIKDLRESSV